MKKTNLLVIVIFTLFLGATISTVVPLIAPNVRDVKDASPKASLILSPSNGDTVSGTVTISLAQTSKLYIDNTLISNKIKTYSWDTTAYSDGSHTIKASYRSTTEIITVTVSNGGTPPPPPPPGNKYAVIVGISDYKAINDLSYCDEDASDWYNYLVNKMGYSSDNIIVLGDTKTANYPKYTALATEYNIKYWLNWLCDLNAEEILFITSGHGSGDGKGSSLLCAWDYGAGENGEDGRLYDTELKTIFTNVVASKVFVFVDHCYAGGLIPEFSVAVGNKLYMTTTCTENGYGYDYRTARNGAWTYFFLEVALINHFGSNPTTAMEDAFDYALANYPYGGGDTPQEQDNYTGSFTL